MMKRLFLLLFTIAVLMTVVAAAQGQAPAPAKPQAQPMAAPPPPGWGPGLGPPGWQQMPPPEPGAFGPQAGTGRHFQQGFGRGRPFIQRRWPGPGMRGAGPGHRHGPVTGMFGEGLRRELNLTQEQQNRLRQMAIEQQKSAIQNRANLQVRELELGELLRAEKPDRAAIDRKIREISELRTAQMKAAIDARLAFQDVLTPEQREKLRGLRQPGLRQQQPSPPKPSPPTL